MPKLKNSVPTLRYHRASGKAVVTLAGKDYLETYGSKAAERAYGAKISEWLASGRSPSSGIAQDQLTVAQLLNSYRKYSEAYYGTAKKSTYHDTKHASSRTKVLYATTVVADFEPIHFKAILQKLIDAKLARVYINKTMVLKIFKWGMAEGIVPVEVFQRLKAGECLRRGFTKAPERDAVRPVDVATVNATLPHLPPVVQNMVKLHLLIGCRSSELCSIKAGMVDRTGDVWQVRLTKNKNANRGKERVLYLGPKAQVIVAPLLLRGADEYLFSPLESERKRRQVAHEKRATPMNQGNRPGYGKLTRNGTRKRGWTPKACYTTCSYSKAIRRACIKAKVAKWSPNQIRHAVATEIRKQFGPEAAAFTLGHSELNTTQIYAEQDVQRALDVARKTMINGNAAMTAAFNRLDHYADLLDCANVVIHHSSKGDQSVKPVADVGAGF